MWQAEDSSDSTVQTDGILADTPIATPLGWRDAGTLRVGDSVLTFDMGAQLLVQVGVLPMVAGSGLSPQAQWPLLVPVGALDNREDMRLLPDQKVLIECDHADRLYGEPFALIPAAALLGYRGIDLCRPAACDHVVRLGFASDQIVYASRGVLLSCPDPMLELRRDVDAMMLRAARGDYPVLSIGQAREVVGYLMAEGLARDLTRRVQITP